MGFFDFLKKSAEPAAPAAPAFPVTLAADAKGTVVAMENIPDEVFAQGILGKCCGIDPTEGKIYAPADGEITQAPDSGHALGILTTAGVEVLIHVGVDTVEMKGDGFSPKVKVGDKIKKGDLLLEMDLTKIAAAGHPAVVITVITNMTHVTAMTSFTAQNLGAGNHDRIRRGALQALGMMAIIAVAEVSCGLLLTLNNTYLHIFLSADKITADTIRFGNTFLYVDYSMYLFLGCVFIIRNCVQGIGRSQFVLGAGAAELVARIAVCLVLPAAVAGGAVSAAASPAAFYALCAADPLAWIAADIIMGIPVVRNILRKDYRYMNL